ncbi:polysaccharide deacetylase family protein [Aneurinibacillus sp. Ricciae_BoGa-3]|uniref:polysaccharide deacetylase family protein n=1 Tax=Aneurinibacillus sp. Ricciae_BoGa-3 TaxID=3022697 RepID=UPI002340350B|nr:polysaccharide deacetylase family protein [Aneurinibacillus sp. Ricciae_BoGa-3]WCK54235.1 polysaccharide deacetylase family protein [Aneurinibacillus sp. Ricciae_BoGa-3]
MKQQRKAIIIWSALGCLAIIIIVNFIFNHASPLSASPAQTDQANQANVKNTDTLPGDTNKKLQQKIQEKHTPTASALIQEGNTALPLGKLIANIPAKDNKTVYLTFDDGPGNYTKDIASILQHYGIHGSFFWIGDQVTNELGQFGHQMIEQGDVIGSHTMHHDALGKENAAQQKEDLTATATLLEKKIGHKIDYIRPPYGSVNRDTKKVGKEIGEYIIFWQVDSLDWSLAHDPQKILTNIEKDHLTPGAIILMHERKQTVEMLPKVIEYIRSKGYNMAALPASPIPKVEKGK